MDTARMSSAASGKATASPCAACKILRRRCAEKCVLAPYFPPTNPHKFATAHRVFGASNIIKMLKELPIDRRADAVSSMVYEANSRLRDPIYGCAGTICQLQHQISQLQSQLAAAHAELWHLYLEQNNLQSLLSALYTTKEEESSPPESSADDKDKNMNPHDAKDLFSDELDPLMLWEPFST